MHMMNNGMSDAEISNLFVPSQGTSPTTHKQSFLQSLPPWFPTFVGDLAPNNVREGCDNLFCTDLLN